MNTWQIGEVTVQRVLEFEDFLIPAAVLLPDSTPEELEEHWSWLVPRYMAPDSGLMHLAFHSYLVRHGDLVIVVDTCGGNDKHRPSKLRYHQNAYPYLARFAACGLGVEAVDFVLCTHLHADHVGWNTRLVDGRWVPTFPNAKYLFSKVEFEYWQAHENRSLYTEDPYFEDSVLPVIESGQARFVEMDYAFNDAIRLLPTAGHTPGHVCLSINSAGRSAVLSGDLMHHPVQCNRPDWNSCFCVDPQASRATREAFVERYGGTDTLIMPAHFPTPSAGLIVPRGDSWHFEFEPGNG